MKRTAFQARLLRILLFSLILGGPLARSEVRVPGFSAYLEPDPSSAKISKAGVTDWKEPAVSVSWFGKIPQPGTLIAAVKIRIPKGEKAHLRLSAGGAEAPEVVGTGSGDEPLVLTLGEFHIARAGYTRFVLTLLNSLGDAGLTVEELILDGPAAENAHFNLDPRRNAASVHLIYPLPNDAPAALFYNEATALTDPVASYYMACGFSRGYFGMQVNSGTERRIIFSVWDSGVGQSAKDRTGVPAEDRVKLLAKGEDVVASDFGNEGTGGHSHLRYAWKTGEPQKFIVTARAEGEHTDYTGFWFHPEKRQWLLIASFRAPRDGKWLRGLYSFSENFAGSNGHLQRKALFGPQWAQMTDGQWHEITEASFSHDGTGKENRRDRFMGVERGQFFLSNGGFVPGFTKFGGKFTRPATGHPPEFVLPVPPSP